MRAERENKLLLEIATRLLACVVSGIVRAQGGTLKTKQTNKQTNKQNDDHGDGNDNAAKQ